MHTIDIDSSLEMAIAALQLGRVGDWNAWRKQNPNIHPVLDGIELECLDLSFVDFSNLSLKHSRIRHCDLRGALMISCNLFEASLDNNDLTEAKLIAASLVGANLSFCCLKKTSFLMASWQRAVVREVDFSGQDLRGFDLRGADLSGSNLSGQNLSGQDFSRARLLGCDLSRCDFTGANLTDVDLRQSKTENCLLAAVNCSGANLESMDLSDANLCDVNFARANLSGTDLRRARLDRAIFDKAIVSGCKFWGATHSKWVISEIICQYAYWDQFAKTKTHYRSREFERIYSEAVVVELNYPHRLSASELTTLPIFIEHLQASHWGIAMRLKSVQDVAGGARVQLVVDELGQFVPAILREDLQKEAERIQSAQLALRNLPALQWQLKEHIGAIREKFWPRLLELADDHSDGQVRNLTVVFMDLKGFSVWPDDERSEKLALFRGLLKPVLKKWRGSYPNMEGDSLRITFHNASVGLACACMIRNVLIAAGFELRLGVDLGDVRVVHNEVTEIADLEGAAVTMAARLEALAEPGDVLVSEKVRHYTNHRGNFAFERVRLKFAKNVGSHKAGDTVECHKVTMLKPVPVLDD